MVEIINNVPEPPKPRKPLVKDLQVLDTFMFMAGFPPNETYDRIFYMRLPNGYVQLNGPSRGTVWNGPSVMNSGPIIRLKSTIDFSIDEVQPKPGPV